MSSYESNYLSFSSSLSFICLDDYGHELSLTTNEICLVEYSKLKSSCSDDSGKIA